MLRSDFVNNIVAAVKKHSMFSGGESVLIGLSGGPDSVCLLHVLRDIKDDYMLTLGAVYIDHGLRPDETADEAAFCRQLCENLDVPFTTRSVDVKSYAKEQRMNKQEAARQLRYRAFDEVCYETGAAKIALGHTADDQAETLLMRLLRGSGPAGLAGIPPVRKNIIRPLIGTERRDIERFLAERKIGSIVDSSNTKEDYLRNRIRLSIFPMLRELNPDITGALSKTAAIIRDEEKYFEIIVTKALMKLISRKTDSRIELFLSPVESMDKIILRRVLRRAIEETKDLRGITFIHIEDIIDLIKKGAAGDRLYLPGGLRVIRQYSTLLLTSDPPVTLGIYPLIVPGETILKEAGILIKASITELPGGIAADGLQANDAFFDSDKLIFPLAARPRKDGDFFYPLGFGKRKKMQDFFVDEKVPRDERDRTPLIVSGKDIIWVLGYRGDERFKVTEETKNVLRLEVKKIRD